MPQFAAAPCCSVGTGGKVRFCTEIAVNLKDERNFQRKEKWDTEDKAVSEGTLDLAVTIVWHSRR